MLVEFLIKVAIAPLLFASAFMNRPVLEVFSVDGRRMEPPISIAVVRHANRSERYSVKNLCSESWPNGEPLSWFLLFHLGTHQINNLFDLLRRAVQSHNNSAHGNFYLQPWCSNSILPSIINGRPIVRINETSDGKEYNVAYRTPDGDNVSSIIHNVVDGALNSADGNLLFRNLTLLKQVEYALQNNDATEAYAVHNTYGEEYYINAFGMPITSNVVEWEFEIMFCKHSGVKPFCLESQSRSVLGVEYEFCQRCKHGLQGINCQLGASRYATVDCPIEYVKTAPLLFASAFMNRPVLEVFSVDGRRMEPPISIAVVRHANRSERYSVKNLCSESWPNGEPLSWFLLFHLGTHQINNLFDLLRRAVQSHNNSAHGNFYLQPWCSNSILPSIINGRPIVRINETSDGKEYNVAYRTPDGDNVSSIIHNVVDGALNSADGNLLFRNLTLLKQVEYALQNNDATEAYAVHNTYGEEYYINAFGMPITSNVVEWEFEIMFCKHSGVKPFCLESQSRSVLGVEFVHTVMQLIPMLCVFPKGSYRLCVPPSLLINEVHEAVDTQLRVTIAGQTSSGQAHFDTLEMGPQCKPA
ncbi:hypothetical protein M513_13297 [Trichuris suis]|uniref:Histidine acid phosphatase n=1 Tax=Trichuris suis TaxID=68888 RepID=A0A085LLI6_9BILA|nr:hypothetical protein M513_13297 [Trichuris suis]